MTRQRAGGGLTPTEEVSRTSSRLGSAISIACCVCAIAWTGCNDDRNAGAPDTGSRGAAPDTFAADGTTDARRPDGAADAADIEPSDDGVSDDAAPDDSGSGEDVADGGRFELPTGTGPDFVPPSEPGRHDVVIRSTRTIVPSDGLRPETPPDNSNNNLDVVRHDGRVYLAWRTAPDHFASAEARLHVVSSADERSWRWETSVHLGTDVREPRLLSLGNELHLYFAELGTERLAFEPRGMWRTTRGGDGAWSEPERFYRDGFIPWRVKARDGRGLMTAYEGGEHIYRFDGEPLFIELLESDDGRTWRGVDPEDPVVSSGGGSETAFAFRADGSLRAVIRNEAGDETGFGSKICAAPADDITDWTCAWDPRKYDSPLMFTYDGETYLIARRNVTETGAYDLQERSLGALEAPTYQLEYSNARKRCSVWRYDETRARIVFVVDLPSRGDTCFPGIVEPPQDGTVVVYNYTSPLEGPEPSWSEGQRGQTIIVRHELGLELREE